MENTIKTGRQILTMLKLLKSFVDFNKILHKNNLSVLIIILHFAFFT